MIAPKELLRGRIPKADWTVPAPTQPVVVWRKENRLDVVTIDRLL